MNQGAAFSKYKPLYFLKYVFQFKDFLRGKFI